MKTNASLALVGAAIALLLTSCQHSQPMLKDTHPAMREISRDTPPTEKVKATAPGSRPRITEGSYLASTN